MKYIFTALLSIMIAQFNFGQVGTIIGIVLDKETKEGLIAASITVYKSGTERPITGTSTDIAGKFTLDSIPAGVYDVEYSYVGYTFKKFVGVEVKNNQKLNVKVELYEAIIREVLISSSDGFDLLINQYEPFTGRIYSADDIRNLPIRW